MTTRTDRSYLFVDTALQSSLEGMVQSGSLSGHASPAMGVAPASAARTGRTTLDAQVSMCMRACVRTGMLMYLCVCIRVHACTCSYYNCGVTDQRVCL